MSLPVQSYDNVRAHLKAALESAKLAKHSADGACFIRTDCECIVNLIEDTIDAVNDQQRDARLRAAEAVRLAKRTPEETLAEEQAMLNFCRSCHLSPEVIIAFCKADHLRPPSVANLEADSAELDRRERVERRMFHHGPSKAELDAFIAHEPKSSDS